MKLEFQFIKFPSFIQTAFKMSVCKIPQTEKETEEVKKQCFSHLQRIHKQTKNLDNSEFIEVFF